MHELQRPASIGLRLDQDRRTRTDGTLTGFPRADRKAFFAIEPVDGIDAGRHSILPKQDEQPTVAETPPLVGEVAQLRSPIYLRRSTGPITDRLAVSGYDLAGPTLRKADDGPQIRAGFMLGGSPYLFL